MVLEFLAFGDRNLQRICYISAEIQDIDFKNMIEMWNNEIIERVPRISQIQI